LGSAAAGCEERDDDDGDAEKPKTTHRTPLFGGPVFKRASCSNLSLHEKASDAKSLASTGRRGTLPQKADGVSKLND
jgi:hypothetical protein